MKKWLPVLVCSLLVLSACGGSSSSGNGPKPEDDDKDTIINSLDNCPSVANVDQLDTNGDGIGDACEAASVKQIAIDKISQYAKSNGSSAAPTIQDYTDAGLEGVTDKNIAQLNQALLRLNEEDVDTLSEIQKVFDDLEITIPELDLDSDGIIDSIDNCPAVANPDQKDTDKDKRGDACDDTDDRDDDNDTVINSLDNCPAVANTDQKDKDDDKIGDACDDSDDRDDDNDGVKNSLDNCPVNSNADQKDKDDDGIGDVCDTTDNRDVDNDGVANNLDNCPVNNNPAQEDKDNDGIGDTCDPIDNRDQDSDGVSDLTDNCPALSNPNQKDIDNDGVGDACDTVDNRDNDNDGINNSLDNCPDASNPNQSDVDKNGIGDACDTTDFTDDDNDGVINILDNCPLIANPDQADSDNDNIGNVCDPKDGTDTDGDGVPDIKDDFPNDNTKAASITNAHRLLTQATFGPNEAEIDRVVAIGTEAWIDEQLNLVSAYDSTSDAHKTHLERTIDITETSEPTATWYNDEGLFNTRSSGRVAFYQMSDWWENALGHPTNIKHGNDQLRQRVAYALSQILVTSALDPRLKRRSESLAFYNDILARNAFGNYRDLLGEISRSATMGVYLSHQGNDKANPSKGTRPDENFARELIQLFAIGLYELNLDGSANRDNNINTYPDAGDNLIPSYTQEDVEEIAKVMTGWDLKDNKSFGRTSTSYGDYSSFMVFHPEHHEDEVAEGGDGNVTVLGNTFALNSGADGSGMDSVLDTLFNHSNIAPFISQRLITLLVTSNPSSAYVTRVSGVFNNNGNGIKGDLKAVIKAILSDPEARSSATLTQANFGKIKEPILAWTQLLRTFHVAPLDGIKSPRDENGDRILLNGTYAYYNPQADFGQAPFRSKSVFNFYKPDYVPSDTYFSASRLVAPESQIQTDQTIVEINNTFYNFIRNYEKNKIIKQDGRTLMEFANARSVYSAHAMFINFDKELEVFELALDGDSNGDFLNMDEVDANDNIPYKEKAVDALLTHLNKIMLGDTMTSEFREILRNYLLNASGLHSSNKFREALHIVRDSVRFITTSSAFMIQK